MPLEKNSRRRCRYLQHKYSPPAIKITATAESTVLNMITRFLLPATPSSPPGEVSLVTASAVVGTAEAGISVDIISATSVSGYEEAMEEEKGEVVEIDVKVKSVSEGTAPVLIGASSGPVEVDGIERAKLRPLETKRLHVVREHQFDGTRAWKALG